jgi:hypothetical protein
MAFVIEDDEDGYANARGSVDPYDFDLGALDDEGGGARRGASTRPRDRVRGVAARRTERPTATGTRAASAARAYSTGSGGAGGRGQLVTRAG